MTLVNLTDAAKRHLLTMLTTQGRPAVKLGLLAQGCNGYKYTWETIEKAEGDNLISLDDQHFLVIDNDIASHVKGSNIVLENSGFFSVQLTLENPNVAGSCGCGESVNFK